jgi:hypothetical protein
MSAIQQRIADVLAEHRAKYDSFDQNMDSWYCDGCPGYYRTRSDVEQHVAEKIAEAVGLTGEPKVYHVSYWDPCNGIGGRSQSHGYFATEELANQYIEPRAVGWDQNAYSVYPYAVRTEVEAK